MMINMNETKLCTIEQIEQFLSGCTQIEFTKSGDDNERYEHISRVLKRFDYPRQGKREKGLLLKYLQVTSDYIITNHNPPIENQVNILGKPFNQIERLRQTRPTLKHQQARQLWMQKQSAQRPTHPKIFLHDGGSHALARSRFFE
jgi:hypothetical protein